jgi:hypothetical protein
MTRQEMLKQMGLTQEELKDLLVRLTKLRADLTEPQRAVFDRSLPTHATAAKTFGADVTAANLQELLSAEVQDTFSAMAMVAHPNK